MVRQSLEAVLRHASIPRASLPKGKTLGLALSCRPTNNRPTGPPIVYFSGERRRQQGVFSRLLPLYRAQPRAGPHGPPSARLSLVKRPRERAGCARPLLTHYALYDCLGRSAATRHHAYRTLFRAALDAGLSGSCAPPRMAAGHSAIRASGSGSPRLSAEGLRPCQEVGRARKSRTTGKFYSDPNYSPVAQLDRAQLSEGRGQGFESPSGAPCSRVAIFRPRTFVPSMPHTQRSGQSDYSCQQR